MRHKQLSLNLHIVLELRRNRRDLIKAASGSDSPKPLAVYYKVEKIYSSQRILSAIGVRIGSRASV